MLRNIQVPRANPFFVTDTVCGVLKRAAPPAGFHLRSSHPSSANFLGSAFDASSLGKWIYDWAVHSVGSQQPIAEIAGEIRLLFTVLSEKAECVPMPNFAGCSPE
jgi:hypothetical protein